ncbi:MAG: metallophosphoesterase [Gemmatimonadaceae bacterium]
MSTSSPPRQRNFGQRFLLYQIAAWLTLVALTIGHPWATVAVLATVAYVTIPAVLLFRWRGWPFYPGALFRIFIVRGVIYGQLLLPIVAGAALLGALVGALMYAPLAGGRWGAEIAFAIAALTLFAGYIGSRTLAVREIEARIESLPAGLDGLRVVQISDLHVGPQTPRGFLARVRRAVESLHPDLITVTGDLIDDRHEDVAHYAAAFASLSAPLGVFAVAGNHDVYAGWEAVERELRSQTTMTVLVNESRVVERNGERLTVVGVGDPAGRGRRPGGGGMSRVAPDVPRALAGAPPGVPVLALAHNPALWPELAAADVALTLSGHTHWGQFALPGFGWSLVTPFLEHAMGAYRNGRSLLYVHPGTGYWGIPFRIGARPAVTAIILKRATESAIVE